MSRLNWKTLCMSHKNNTMTTDCNFPKVSSVRIRAMKPASWPLPIKLSFRVIEMRSKKSLKPNRSFRTGKRNATVSKSSELSAPAAYPSSPADWAFSCRLQATEVQVAQFQAEIATLEKTQLQVEEYKKKTDAKSK